MLQRPETNIKRRFVAGFIDYAIISAITFALIFIIGEPDGEGGYSLSGAPALIPILLWFILTVGLETALGGTLGNSIVRLKVIPASGTIRNLTIGESLKRHLMDPVDMFLFGIVAIVTISNTDRKQRVGDIWAETIVVKMKHLNL